MVDGIPHIQGEVIFHIGDQCYELGVLWWCIQPMQDKILGLGLNNSMSLGVAQRSVDLLQLQIISLVWSEDSLRQLQAINPKGTLALLLLVHSGS